MITSKGSPVEKMAEVNNFLLQATNEECLDYSYQTMIQELSEVSWDSEAGEGGRQWTEQVKFKCSEKATKISQLIMYQFGDLVASLWRFFLELMIFNKSIDFII